MSQARYRIRYREAKAQAVIAAVVGWACIVVFVAAGRGDRSLFGPLKWADFVHFYTLGDLVLTRSTPLLYDRAALHERQARLVPASSDDQFVPVYAPQTALLFFPFSLLPYFVAGLAWVLVTLGVYLWAVRLAWKPARDAIPDWTFVVAAALASPAAWQLAGYGQSSAVIVAAFWGAYWALERERRLLAGLALSLVAVKPQFGLVLAVLAVGAAEATLTVGVVLGLLVQVLAAAAVFGWEAFADYVQMVRSLPSIAPLLEPTPWKMHSIHALTRLLGPFADSIAWAVLSTAIAITTILVWRRPNPWPLRFGTFVLASALVCPHLAVYDLVVLTPAIVAIGGSLGTLHADTTWYWQRVYFVAVFLLIPTAAVVGIQLSTILMAELFVRVARVGLEDQRWSVHTVMASGEPLRR